MKPGQQTEFADRIFLISLMVGVLTFAIATTQLGTTARTVPVWVLIVTAMTLVAALLEDIRRSGQHKYRLQRPAPARQTPVDAPQQSCKIDVLLFLSAPLLIYGLGFALGGSTFILVYAYLKQRLSVLRTALLGGATCMLLAGLQWLYQHLVS